MKKIICIGECAIDLVLDNAGNTLGAAPAGRIVNAAAALACKGHNVIMASETAADPIGQSIVDMLQKSGVDTKSIDRFTEGRTPINAYINNIGSSQMIRYENYPPEAFDIIWPRIDENDIILFGGFYTIDARMRQRMYKLLIHASERKAILVYLPGFPPQREPRITRVMPQILENLEISNIVITRNDDLKIIFGTSNENDAFSNHISFYCPALININPEDNSISFLSRKNSERIKINGDNSKSITWQAAAVAGIVDFIANNDFSPKDCDSISSQNANEILQNALTFAANSEKQNIQSWKLNP